MLTLKEFDTFGQRDFENGATLDKIRETIKKAGELLEAAKSLELYLLGTSVKGFDVPDDIWVPFIKALDACEGQPLGKEK